MSGPVVVRGSLGWGNRKGGLEAYGPAGRWGAPRNGQQDQGDLLGDALEEAGVTEGAELIVVAVPRGGKRTPIVAEALAAAITTLVADWPKV